MNPFLPISLEHAVTSEHSRSQAQQHVLIRYDAMCKAIAECHRVDEVKELRDKARALEVYAQQARNTEAEDKAREIRLRAERRTGELLAELERMPREERAEKTNMTLGRRMSHDRTCDFDPSERSSHEGTNVYDQEGSMLHDQTCMSNDATCIPQLESHSSSDRKNVSPYAAALKETGISRQTANRYQKLAAVPEADFEAAIRDPSQKPTTAKLIQEAYNPPKPQMDDKSALWIWGRAREFEDRGLSERLPSDLFKALLPNMQNDMRRLVPLLADFYSTFKEVIR